MTWTARNTGLGLVDKWWLAPTISPTEVEVAYAAIGAASLADSYVNLSDPGTNDATAISAPTWNVDDGWIFAAAESLSTGVAGDGIQSMIARISTNTTSNDGVFGYFGGSPQRHYMRVDGATPSTATATLGYGTGAFSSATLATTVADMVVCAARNLGYLDNQEFGPAGSLTSWSGPTITIGGSYNGSGQLDGTMKAFAIYNRQLTFDEVVEITASMKALTSVRRDSSKVRYITIRPSTKRLNNTSQELLIATQAGIYHTTNGGIYGWNPITLPDPSNAEFADSPAATIDELDFHYVDYSPVSENIVLAIAEKASVNRQWIYKSTDNLETWASRGIVTA